MAQPLSLGQALAANSLPVVLTAAQLATLTPPAAITGFATEATLSLFQTTLTAKFAGAPTLFRNAGANATLNVKSSAGILRGFSCYNINNSARFIQLWNSATVAGSGTLMISKLVPSNSEVIIGTDYLSEAGLAFSSGIAFGFSTARSTYSAGVASDQDTEILYI